MGLGKREKGKRTQEGNPKPEKWPIRAEIRIEIFKNSRKTSGKKDKDVEGQLKGKEKKRKNGLRLKVKTTERHCYVAA